MHKHLLYRHIITLYVKIMHCAGVFYLLFICSHTCLCCFNTFFLFPIRACEILEKSLHASEVSGSVSNMALHGGRGSVTVAPSASLIEHRSAVPPQAERKRTLQFTGALLLGLVHCTRVMCTSHPIFNFVSVHVFTLNYYVKTTSEIRAPPLIRTLLAVRFVSTMGRFQHCIYSQS